MSFQSLSRLALPALVFTAAAQGIAIPSPPTWPSGQCTDKSLTIPSWVIADYKVSASGTVTFGVTNRAADSHGTVTCAKSQPCTVAGNSQLAAAVSEGSSSPVVTIEESWTCNDREKALTFNATGSATVFSLEKSSSGDASSPITYLAYATLSEPVPLTPVQPSPPPGYSLPTCADVSKSPALFTVTDISFKNVTRTQCKTWYGTIFCLDPRPPTEVVYAGLYLNLTVRNEAIQHTLSCDLTMPNATAPDVVTPVRCTGGNFNEIALDISMAGTQPQITIAVDQMWYCLENPNQNTKPTAILATGAAPITLSCTSKPGIFGTPDDVITTCSQQSGGPLSIKGKLKEKKEQPAYSLVTGPPTSGGCLVTSLVKPEWKITNPSFSTNFAKSTTNQSLWELGVKLGTPRFEHWFYVFAGENKYPGTDDPDTWYRCEWSIPGGWLPWDCKVQYNYHTTTLGLDVIWGCEEKDPAHPLFFHSTGSIVMPHDQSWYCGNSNPNRTTCAYQGLWEKTFPVPHITVGLTNVEPPKPW